MYFSRFKKGSEAVSLGKTGFLFLLLCLGISACAGKPAPYLYPGTGTEEVTRICQIALNWQKSSFSIVNRKVQILNPLASPYIELRQPLPDGFYYCGNTDSTRWPCAVGTKRTLYNERCTF